MNTPWPDQKKLVAELLLKGKESAIQLQTLLQKPLENDGSVSAAELSVQILRSFTDTLSELGLGNICQIVAADGAAGSCSSDRSSKTTDRLGKKPGVKDRRGSYRRRNVFETQTKLSSTLQDEYAWRKYGQKDILRSKFPRCYFRCTHRNEQGCKATKQVQMIKQDPIVYQTTYFGRHTCNDNMRAPQIIQESDGMDFHLLSFETKMPSKQDSVSSAINPSPKEVIKMEDAQSDAPDNKSLLHSALWQDLVTSVSSGPANPAASQTGWDHHLEEVASGICWCPSDSLHGLDMEALSNFADIDSFFFDPEKDFRQFSD